MNAEKVLKKPAAARNNKKIFFAAAKKMPQNLNLPSKVLQKPIDIPKLTEKAKMEKEKRSPKTALKKPLKEIKTAAKRYRNHKDKDAVSAETKSAGILAPEIANKALANKNQVDLMHAQTVQSNPDPKKFGKEKFKKTIKDQINTTAKNKAEAKKIKNNGVDESVTNTIGKSLAEEKDKVGGKVQDTTIPVGESPQLSSSEATDEQPLTLKANTPENKTITENKKNLAPQARPKAETDLTKDTKVLEDDYKQNNLSQEKLQNSNEPTFIAADRQKQDSEVKAQELTEKNRSDEAKKLAGTRHSSALAMNEGYQTMLTKNVAINNGSLQTQKDKSAEEKTIRIHVSTELDKIFQSTNEKVLSYFKAIDDFISGAFTNLMNMALNKFSTRVADLLDDNTGILNNIGAAITGDELLSEGKIFDIARKEFIEDMDAPINILVDTVDVYMNLTLSAINNGKKEKDKFWDSQDKNTQKIAGDIKTDSDTKFTDLESSVEAKENAIIDTITEKFSEALEDLDSRFEKAKIENMSWLDRAIAAVKAVINTIIDLKNSIKAIAKKAAQYAEKIIDDPITFFGNLADAVGNGFTNFKNNIDKHLIKGVLDWLTGAMAGSEIILPKEFNPEGITNLVLQILGISIKKIKEIVIGIIGEERFAFIEKGVDKAVSAGNNILNIFKILNEKGLGGLWEFLQEEFGNLKEMLLENVKTFIIEAITTKALELLLSLLIPAAGFIKAAQLLIRFVVTLFQKAGQILKIIEGIIDSFGDILNKNLSAASEKVESVLGGFISLAISFLAAVLGLNGIVDKVKKFIQNKIKPFIDKALNKIAQKIKSVAEKIGLLKLIDKSVAAVDKGKAWVEDKKKKAADTAKKYGEKILNWLGIHKKFKAVDGKMHTLFFEGSEKKPDFMIASDKMTFNLFIDKITVDAEKKECRALSDKINDILNDDVSIENDEKKRNSKIVENQNRINAYLDKIAKIAAKYFKFSELPVSKIHFDSYSIGGGVMGKKMLAFPLTSNHAEGTESTNDRSNPAYNKIEQRGYLNGSFYVKGHLLNNNLGGPGSWMNYTPLPGANFNTKIHYLKYEKPLKTAVENQEIFYYKVDTIYGRSKPPPKNTDTAIVTEIKDGEDTVPTAIKIEIFKYDFNADSQNYEKSKSQPNFAGEKVENITIDDSDYYSKGSSTGVVPKIYSLKGKSFTQLINDGVDLDIAKKIADRKDENLSITNYFQQIGVSKEILLNLIKRKDNAYTDISQN